ncbi:MAG TPA: DUF1273 domain-containing protein [Tidjanibacter sp.]|jgi:uncharacterized phage-like protein YoqJ|nr:DUF1273 domain-containing protein [Tidjanibacter sp.]
MMRTGVLYGGEAETFGFGRTECAAFTGYRPAKFLAAFPQGDARQCVGELLRPVVAGLYDRGVRLFLSGMAEGFDLWAAAEVLALRDRGRCPDAAVAAVIPFRGQERGYAPASLDEYRFICARAVAVRVLSDRYYPECFYRRNDFLVDNASVVVGYYDGQRGGTAYTFRRAYSRGVPVVNICSGEPALFYP